MQKQKNEIWAFLASVKLALFTFFVLALTSVIGTIIPQGKEMDFYVQNFGAGWAKFFQVLNVPDMYNSWWFVSLLVLFSLNLVVCTIDRFPNIWRLVTMDNLAMELDRLPKMPNRHHFASTLSPGELAAATEKAVSGGPWQFQAADRDGDRLLFAQKGNWTRLGVIMVHVSILVIFVGAIIGAIFGAKGFVMITEGRSTNQIYAFDANRTPIPLGFEVRCDRFVLDLYDTGAPKEFISDLVVLKEGKEILKKSIEVNDPLQYGGFTFYQSSYQGYDDFVVVDIENATTTVRKKFAINPGRQVQWPEENLTFGIVNQMGSGMGGARFKIWLKSGEKAPIQFWTSQGQSSLVEGMTANYSIVVKPLFATGLQVSKDPGVWYVYAGCALMLIGLYVAFFLSHRKIWLHVSGAGSGSTLLVSGSSNKNKIGFESDFAALVASLEQNESLKLKKE